MQRSAHGSLGSAVAWLPPPAAAPAQTLHLLSAGFDKRVVLWKVIAQLEPAAASTLGMSAVASGGDLDSEDDDAPVSVLAPAASAAGSRRGRKQQTARARQAAIVPALGVSDSATGSSTSLVFASASLAPVRRWDAAQWFAAEIETVVAAAAAPGLRGTAPKASGRAAPPVPAAVAADVAVATTDDAESGVSDSSLPTRMINPPFVHAVAWLPLPPAPSAAAVPPEEAQLPAGAAFVAAAGDGTLSIVDVSSGRLLARWRAHGSAATSVAVAPPAWSSAAMVDVNAAGTAGAATPMLLPLRVFSAGNDRRLCLWQVDVAAADTAGAAGGDGDDDDDLLPAGAPAPPLRATRLWRARHARGGIHGICVEMLAATGSEPAAVVLAIADVSPQVSLRAWALAPTPCAAAAASVP